AIRDFCERIGVTKNDTVIDVGVLENCVREELDRTSARALAVLNPLKVVIENYPDQSEEMLEAINHPNDPAMGTRAIPFSRTIYIEREDFMEDPPKKFFRLGPGREVRLRYAYFIRCEAVIKDDEGNVIELRCSYDPQTRGGQAPDGRKVRGTIHWVSAQHAIGAEVRLYDRLFSEVDPEGAADDWKSSLNPDSRQIIQNALLEPALAAATTEQVFQFERLGYFCADEKDHANAKPVFNRTITLRDSWAKAR
ncbi:MAG: glutamine--tRNA ligase, partial [Thiotrichales bacterium]|nr:glutamine--tRNA ligase [Thiotrichales bacterium]